MPRVVYPINMLNPYIVQLLTHLAKARIEQLEDLIPTKSVSEMGPLKKELEDLKKVLVKIYHDERCDPSQQTYK